MTGRTGLLETVVSQWVLELVKVQSSERKSLSYSRQTSIQNTTRHLADKPVSGRQTRERAFKVDVICL